MNNEEKLEKAIKKMQGFSSFSVVAKYHDNSNQANPITIIQYRIDAENERAAMEIFTTTHPTTNCWEISVVNLDTNNGISEFF
jgi:type III secretory pathway lipoprotein EscJ